MYSELTQDIQVEFEQAFGAQFVTTTAVREHHAQDESAYDKTLPDAVIFARNTEDVIKAVKLCSAYNIPIVPFGAGTSIEGHILPIHGGITLDLSEMNKVLSVDDQDFTVTVQPGVLRHQLNEEIRHTGLYFPIDPGANASIGGMVSTRASGTTAVRYGTMRENVLSLKVVTADGELIRTSSRAAKSSAGYDLTRLFIGSEGTLGIIVEITLKVYPVPEEIVAAICAFPTLEDAVNCTVMIRQSGTQIGRVEFLDSNAIRAVNGYSHLGLKEVPTLFFEFHGSASGIQEQIELIKELAKECGGSDFEWASKTEERNRLWTARHNAYFASLQLRPNSRSITTDVCVPISSLAQCVSETAADLAGLPFPWTMLGHVGDGNFHVLMMIDPHNESEREQAEAFNQRLVRRAIAMDGTCTGEHGIGIHKMEFLKEELGEPVIDMMRRIKHAFDPKNILNPGKVFSWNK
ncbi:FAD-binding oxidoreductase [Pelistega europaea]|uniref:D-lactate dehydrogenase (cytochrome) n=1 Tax=Pelistega europaea TaxID=106147 RepID=A0A7Y4LAV8_9BURK|nr:FAD-linked oxidase C-terminal domain-containing protein [Pelistega europaea]NOL50093.1 FAD-binding protein [Pelistega europaea]